MLQIQEYNKILAAKPQGKDTFVDIGLRLREQY
jgi:hypothetical protein